MRNESNMKKRLRGLFYTRFEDVDETHEKSAQLLAVECVLLLSHVHFHLLTGDFIQQHSYQLQKESENESQRENMRRVFQTVPKKKKGF